MDLYASPYPLRKLDRLELKTLCKVLWNWQYCAECATSTECPTNDCPWQRSKRLESYFRFYQHVTTLYVPEFSTSGSIALRSHGDLFDIISIIKKNADRPRESVTKEYFVKRYGDPQHFPAVADQKRSFDMAVKVMTMVECSSENQSLGNLEKGVQPIIWRDDTSLAQFLSSAFPKTNCPSLNQAPSSARTMNIRDALKVTELKKIAGLRFRPTDDLRHHLRLDPKTGWVDIFHHTRALKEHLIATLAEPNPKTDGEAIERGNLPRQLALEILDSVQKVLFPFESEKDALHLETLVTKSSFDEDCLDFHSSSYRRADESSIAYEHMASRLMDLHEELLNPTPRGALFDWIERKSGARYVMMATLGGVVIAVILGIFGLAVGIFQAWVAYEAWKHPAPNAA